MNSMHSVKSKRSGYTLIELLFCFSLIAVLGAIAIPNFLLAQVRSKVAVAKSDLALLSVGLESYYVDYGAYPPSTSWDIKALKNVYSRYGGASKVKYTTSQLRWLKIYQVKSLEASETDVCPDCGTKWVGNEEFCSNCGFQHIYVDEDIENYEQKPVPEKHSVAESLEARLLEYEWRKKEQNRIRLKNSPKLVATGICQDCGAQNDKSAEFCSECGAELIPSGYIVNAQPAEKIRKKVNEQLIPEKIPDGYVECPNCFHHVKAGLAECPHCKESLLFLYNADPKQETAVVEVRPERIIRTEPIRICPDCGTENEPGSEFCVDCGADLTGAFRTSSPVSVSGPRTTVLWGGTVLMQKLPDELNLNLIDPYYQTVLTSPINYLAGFDISPDSGVFKDPFSYDSYEDEEGYSYQYIYLNCSNIEPSLTSNQYVLFSAGPDLKVMPGDKYSKLFISYDPTNGTTTNGNIFFPEHNLPTLGNMGGHYVKPVSALGRYAGPKRMSSAMSAYAAQDHFGLDIRQ